MFITGSGLSVYKHFKDYWSSLNLWGVWLPGRVVDSAKSDSGLNLARLIIWWFHGSYLTFTVPASNHEYNVSPSSELLIVAAWLKFFAEDTYYGLSISIHPGHQLLLAIMDTNIDIWFFLFLAALAKFLEVGMILR